MPPSEPIAIVGTACRFAGGATSPSSLWALLSAPRDVRVPIPESRFSAAGFHHASHAHHGHSNVAHSYLLSSGMDGGTQAADDPAAFDADFFGINALEARAMDPQQRLLLETVYEALEAGGQPALPSLRGSDTAVFAGVMCADYEALLLRDLDFAPTYSAVGTARSVLANRVSYLFDWHGPSVTVDTACSSSLVAVHLAVQALRAGEARMAVACGSNLILGPENYIIESKVKMLSPDGRSRMWDRDANGYARGEGVAAVVLKTLSAALADGDHIECLVRETGVNQDGATAGITMPSAAAQRTLIRSTYARAGLPLDDPVHRPQYFEAHGTGTPAGDPVEAEAIATAFFDNSEEAPPAHPLYVGSVKTVLGHTEGTAGLAGIIKASLALQHAAIPPNLLFDNLAPAVAPFYANLEIRKTAMPWPAVGPGQPRRASVNSFGFGGTNAHAILEAYQPPTKSEMPKEPGLLETPSPATVFTPFVLSASSETSLRATLASYASYLLANPDIDPRSLAHTLSQRRSVLASRVTISASSVADLQGKMTALISSHDGEDTAVIGTRPARTDQPSSKPKLLGVFTGQGAQYAGMAAGLIRESARARDVIRSLEAHLAALPEADRPSWSLEAELLAPAATSRVAEAAISQPLCTAVQILVVDLLRTAGVDFAAVVGHSSGEIGAAYAAGRLSARDAMYIAFYRGLHCRHSVSPRGAGIRGGMLAVGTSMADAADLCDLDEVRGRVVVAACNSSSSVTLSGDDDALAELQVILDDEAKFNRRLRVDQAYHSPHMLACAAPYVEALRQVGIEPLSPASSSTKWYSSVQEGQLVDDSFALEAEYWSENMTRPVLFAQALASAMAAAGEDGTVFDAALEVGAHAALKGPATQTLSEALGGGKTTLPYHGTLNRAANAVEAMASCLGFLWTHLGGPKHAVLDLAAYEAALSGPDAQPLGMLKNLPSYPWNHSVRHWHESRRSRKMRLRSEPFHPLLGHASPDSAPHHLRWKNVLKLAELPWLDGHRVQNQAIFPAAGYLSTAIEAARSLAATRKGNKTLGLVELVDFTIHQAVAFDDADDAGVEVLIELSAITEPQPGRIRARFTYSAALGGGAAADLVLAADGEVDVRLSDDPPRADALPSRGPVPPHLIDVEASRLYGFMESLGYQFTGQFRSLQTLRRKLGSASCTVERRPEDDDNSSSVSDSALLLHPAELDAAFQSVMLAYSYPGDDQLRTLHLPTTVARIRVNPALLGSSRRTAPELLTIDSTCTRLDRRAPGAGFSGHASLYRGAGGSAHAAVQVERVRFIPLGTARDDDDSGDRNVFYKMHWVPSAPDGHAAAAGIPVTQADTDLLWVLSRIASYFLRRFDDGVPADAPARREAPLCHYLNYARHMTALLRSGTHQYGKTAWLDDTLDDVVAEVEARGVADNSDVKIMMLVGTTMPRVFAGETTMLEHMRESGLLDEYYSHGFGTMQSSRWLAGAVRQITERHPHLKLLEIGAGTGGATKSILGAIGRDFASYTFTDISSSFFENAAESLAPWRDRLVFQVCNAELDPVAQGFEEGAYDVIVASLVIHATASLDRTMRNLRRLLRPGGFLVVGEGSSDGPLQSGDGFIFGALPGWWLGVDEGRDISPFVNVDQWDALLRRTGFSGIDTMAPPQFLGTFGVVLFVSQAVDDTLNLLREPLAVASPATLPPPPLPRLVIVGGASPAVANISAEIEGIFGSLGTEVTVFKTLGDVDYAVADAASAIISLAELDKPVFEDLTAETWYAFRPMFEAARTLLWLTTGRLGDDPFANMTIGFGRSAVHETADLRVQFVDVPEPATVDARAVASAMLRFWYACSPEVAARQQEMLWTVEPELVVDAQGRDLVPRLKPIAEANDRYNSATRAITRHVDTAEAVVELCRGEDGRYLLGELNKSDVWAAADTVWKRVPLSQMLSLRTRFTLASALATAVGPKFLVVGVDPEGARYMALVDRLASTLEIPSQVAIPLDGILRPNQTDKELLVLVAAHLTSLTLIDPLREGQTLAVHNASQVEAWAISRQASAKKVQVIFTADTGHMDAHDSALRLPSFLSSVDLGRIIPEQIHSFAGLSRGAFSLAADGAATEAAILANLPARVLRQTAQTLFPADAVETLPSSVPELYQILARVLEYAQQGEDACPQTDVETTPLLNLAEGERPASIIDWTVSERQLPVRVSRFDSRMLFKGDKTYWLCGMSGALGISLCDWMIDRGVKHLVLTSRNPKIEPAWIDAHGRNGVVVKILCCDVTDEAALRATHKTIVETLPPIAGALNGAMVLRDVSIPNMTFDQVADVVRPKVLGSIHLDRIFHSEPLDFFVLLSSINCIIGNVGQANYAAANTGMCGVAANRRLRGLASCVVNVGAVIGAGYITRETDRALDVTVQKMAMMHLSEDDFHQIFAEAVEAGRLDCASGPEISTGLRDISPDSPNIPKWYSNPKFARFIVHSAAAGDASGEQTRAAASVHDQLQACRSPEQVRRVIRSSFAAQLRKILQTSTADDELLAARSADMGLDSLISVDIRTWFLKNFEVSIPVLKIMGNDLLGNLAEHAAENMPATLAPQAGLGRDSEPAEGTGAVISGDGDGGSSSASSPDRLVDGSASVDGDTSAITTPPSGSDGDGDTIDWEAESCPPPTPPHDTAAPAPKSPPEIVVLTGATGLLGHHLLASLLAQPSTRKVICLAVRDLPRRLSTGELPTPEGAPARVEYHSGDLSSPLLGLDAATAASIFAAADAIIHNGADTSHLKYYRALRAANVGSTRGLLALALPRRIPFQYISSAGVALFAGLAAFPPIAATQPGMAPPPIDGAHGYMCGKWVCERMLERAHAATAMSSDGQVLRVVVQRPSTIIRRGADARAARAGFDWVNALIEYAHLLRAVPRVRHNRRGAFDLVRVETVCADVVGELVTGHEGGAARHVKYVNCVGDAVVSMGAMADELAAMKPGAAPYEVVDMAVWGQRAIEMGLHPAVVALIETFDEEGGPEYPRLLREAEDSR